MGLALVAAVWLAAPAAAADLPAAVQAPVADVAAVAGQQATPAADVHVAAAGHAVERAVGQAPSTVERAVSDVTEAVADTGAAPAVEPAIGTVAAPPTPAATARPHTIRDGAAEGAKASTHAYRAPHRGAPPRRVTAARHALLVGPPAGPVTAMEVGGTSRGTVAGPVHSQPARAPSLDPVSGAVDGSPASGASAGIFFGGLAILLTVFLVAAPRLGRRIPGRRAFCPPAAFVPLLERPG